jgi:serine/threonine protein kinase
MSIYENQTGRLSPQAFLRQRYMIIRQAGKGGMSAVYEALDMHNAQQQVAIKEMSQAHLSEVELKAATERFQLEAHLLGSLAHQNLPHILDAFSEKGRSYLVMDFIKGKTLHQLLLEQPGKPLPLSHVIHYAIQLSTVLAYLHQQRPAIIFRDVKPSNIMVTEQGQLFLIDFGIARLFVEGKKQDTVQLGSPGYAPPEQHGLAQTTPRSDLFGLGATLHYCLTGRDPYFAEDHFTFVPIRQINPQVPIELESLIERMLARDERQRPSSATEVLQTLQGLNQQASAHTIAINPAASAPTLYQMPLQTNPRLQATILPGPPQQRPLAQIMDTNPPSGQTLLSGISRNQNIPPANKAAFWSINFLSLMLLLLVISAGGSFLLMNTLYTQATGWAWILESILASLSLLTSIIAYILIPHKNMRILLLLASLFAFASALIALILGSRDITDLLGLRPLLSDLEFALPISLLLTSFCTLGWQFHSIPRSMRIVSLVLSGIAVFCTVVTTSTSQTVTTSWHFLLLISLIALLLNMLLVARLGKLSRG